MGDFRAALEKTPADQCLIEFEDGHVILYKRTFAEDIVSSEGIHSGGKGDGKGMATRRTRSHTMPKKDSDTGKGKKTETRRKQPVRAVTKKEKKDEPRGAKRTRSREDTSEKTKKKARPSKIEKLGTYDVTTFDKNNILALVHSAHPQVITDAAFYSVTTQNIFEVILKEELYDIMMNSSFLTDEIKHELTLKRNKDELRARSGLGQLSLYLVVASSVPYGEYIKDSAKERDEIEAERADLHELNEAEKTKRINMVRLSIQNETKRNALLSQIMKDYKRKRSEIDRDHTYSELPSSVRAKQVHQVQMRKVIDENDTLALRLMHSEMDYEDLNALGYAIERSAYDPNSHLVVKELLLMNAVSPGARNNQAILMATSNQSATIVKLLLEYDPPQDASPTIKAVDARAKSNQSIVTSCTLGDTEIVKMLLNWRGKGNLKGSHVNAAAQGNIAIIAACTRGHTEIVDLLLSWSVKDIVLYEKNQQSLGDEATSILNALYTSLIPLPNLYELAVNPTDNNNAALIGAVKNGHTEIVEMLLNWKGEIGNVSGLLVDPTVPDNLAIDEAVYNKHTDIMILLLKWIGTKYLQNRRVDPTHDDYKLYYWTTVKANNARAERSILIKWKGTGELKDIPGDPTKLRGKEARELKTRRAFSKRLRMLTAPSKDLSKPKSKPGTGPGPGPHHCPGRGRG